jgi:DNA-binding NtrC family response regulator
MTGLDLLSAIRERDPDLPVILVTGNPTAQAEEQSTSTAYGAFKYVVKPLSPFELCETVGGAERRYRVALLKRKTDSHSDG